MKIRITEPGWAGFTGHFGMVEFANGESIDDVTKVEAAQLAGLVQVETLEGKNPSMSQLIVDTNNKPATEEVTRGTQATALPGAGEAYTPEQLAAIADAEGIKGLRKISDTLGVKGTSISELIGKMLQAQEDRKMKLQEAKQTEIDTELARQRVAEIRAAEAEEAARRDATGEPRTYQEEK